MANVLGKDKQISVLAALAEGSSIRSIERITNIHRDTIMRLGVKLGKGCARLLDEKMRGLTCSEFRWMKFGATWENTTDLSRQKMTPVLVARGRFALSILTLRLCLPTRSASET